LPPSIIDKFFIKKIIQKKSFKVKIKLVLKMKIFNLFAFSSKLASGESQEVSHAKI